MGTWNKKACQYCVQTDGQMLWMDGYKSKRMDCQIDALVDKQIDERTEGQIKDFSHSGEILCQDVTYEQQRRRCNSRKYKWMTLKIYKWMEGRADG